MIGRLGDPEFDDVGDGGVVEGIEENDRFRLGGDAFGFQGGFFQQLHGLRGGMVVVEPDLDGSRGGGCGGVEVDDLRRGDGAVGDDDVVVLKRVDGDGPPGHVHDAAFDAGADDPVADGEWAGGLHDQPAEEVAEGFLKARPRTMETTAEPARKP